MIAKNILFAAVLALVCLSAPAGAVPREMGIVKQAKITLPMAIVIAEKQTKGEAYTVVLERIGGAVVYTVKIVRGDELLLLQVDAESGIVIRTETVIDDEILY